MKPITFILALLIILTHGFVIAGESGSEFAIWPTTDDQELPDIDGDIVVWQQFVEEYGDYDIYVADMNNPDDPLALIIGDANDQMRPAVFAPFDSAQGEDLLHAERRRGIVVWQDYIIQDGSGDWDLMASDLSTSLKARPEPAEGAGDSEREQPVIFAVSNIFGNDEQSPAIHGNIVVWQDGAEGDYNIFGADITDPARPAEFSVANFERDQQQPAVYRNTVVWQDSYFGDEDILAADIWQRNKPTDFGVSLAEKDQQHPAVWGDIVVWADNYFGDMDIYAADISDPDNPVEFAITANESEQTNPDIDRNIVVWQDNRNGNWDIYGYNLTTRREFQITNESHDQTNPAISGPFDSAQGEDILHAERRRGTVVWEDNREGNLQIFAIVLDGPEVARCTSKPTGDVNGDCKVDFIDFTLMASQWLECNLEPREACPPSFASSGVDIHASPG
jgi:beta propeller repeat protein